MPALDWHDWFDGHVVYINKTMRPYLKQSILLVNAVRSIQDQYRSPSTESDSDLRATIECVSNALKDARNPEVRHRRSDHVDEVFEKANREVRKFCAKYKIKIIMNEDMDEPIKEDRKATTHLQGAKRIAEKAAKFAGSKGSTTFLVTFCWLPDAQKHLTQRTLEFTVENGIKLDHFLARILQKSLEKKNGLPRVNLIQNPGFFSRIPSTLKDFSEGNRGRLMKHKHQTEPILCQLDLQDKINDRPRGLHLLLDPPVLPESQLTIFDTEKQKDIKRNYRNIWILQDPAYAAAREISGCLVRLDPTKPLPLPVGPEPPPKSITPQQQPPQRPEPTRETPWQTKFLPPVGPIHPLPPQPITPQQQPPQWPEPTRETPWETKTLPSVEPIHPPPPQEPPKPPAKTGFFGKLIPQALKWTDPSPPPKPEPPPPDPDPNPEVYLSRNFMGPIRLEMVGVELPKSKGWFKRRS